MTDPAAPFARPLYIMAKPAGPVCNLACRYCYYLEKSNLYRHSDPAGRFIMSDALLEKFIKEYIESQTTSEVLFTWHGGEALMRPLSFYRKVVDLQRRYARGRRVDNTIQTNGTLLDEKWCRFFRENNWLVGVSLDGPQRFHDQYRRNHAGAPSFRKVMAGVSLLDRYGVDWNALAVVNDINARHPIEFYDFFRQIGCHYIQFTPIVERLAPQPDGRHLAAPADTGHALAPFSVTPEPWGDFLCTLFDEWVRTDVGKYFIQLFDATLANWVGVTPGLCSMAPTCGHAGVMEYNGDVYSCDHFVFPSHRLGNIHTSSLIEMMYSPAQIRFGAAKRDSLPDYCRRCPYLFACNGECPKNRFAHTPDGQPGLNYLCAGYRRFFAHVAPYMDYMRDLIRDGQPPSLVMQAGIKPSGEASETIG